MHGLQHAKRLSAARDAAVFHCDAFAVDWYAKELTCPQGKVSRRWSTRSSLAPYVNAEFAPDGCRQCPVEAACVHTGARRVR